MLDEIVSDARIASPVKVRIKKQLVPKMEEKKPRRSFSLMGLLRRRNKQDRMITLPK